MILIQTPAARILALDVPEDMTKPWIRGNKLQLSDGICEYGYKKLPPGQWELLGRAASLSLANIYQAWKGRKEYELWLAANNITNNCLLLIEIK